MPAVVDTRPDKPSIMVSAVPVFTATRYPGTFEAAAVPKSSSTTDSIMVSSCEAVVASRTCTGWVLSGTSTVPSAFVHDFTMCGVIRTPPFAIVARADAPRTAAIAYD